MKQLKWSIVSGALVSGMLIGCGPAPQYAPPPQPPQVVVVQQPEYEVEKCDWDDHPNEPECRGTKKHRDWLAKQSAKQKQIVVVPAYKAGAPVATTPAVPPQQPQKQYTDPNNAAYYNSHTPTAIKPVGGPTVIKSVPAAPSNTVSLAKPSVVSPAPIKPMAATPQQYKPSAIQIKPSKSTSYGSSSRRK